MKTFLLSFVLFITLMFSCSLQAQVDEPRFPGCDDPADVDCADMKMLQFVFSNLEHPEGNPGGEVVAFFTVKSSGELADISIEEGLTDDCNKEVIRVLRLMPNWLPAEVEGKPVDMEWELVVKFKAN